MAEGVPQGDRADVAVAQVTIEPLEPGRSYSLRQTQLFLHAENSNTGTITPWYCRPKAKETNSDPGRLTCSIGMAVEAVPGALPNGRAEAEPLEHSGNSGTIWGNPAEWQLWSMEWSRFSKVGTVTVGTPRLMCLSSWESRRARQCGCVAQLG